MKEYTIYLSDEKEVKIKADRFQTNPRGMYMFLGYKEGCNKIVAQFTPNQIKGMVDPDVTVD